MACSPVLQNDFVVTTTSRRISGTVSREVFSGGQCRGVSSIDAVRLGELAHRRIFDAKLFNSAPSQFVRVTSGHPEEKRSVQ